MKRSLALILACILVFSALMILASCGSKKQEKKSAQNDGTYEWWEYSDGVMITKYLGTDTEVVIPSELGGVTVANISDDAFASCTTVKSITVPDSVVSLGARSLACPALTELTLGKGVKDDIDSACYGCTALTRLTVNSNEVVDDLYSISFLKNQIVELTLGEGVTEIGISKFSNWPALTTVNLGSSIKKIMYGAFESSSNLKNVTLPEGLTEVSGNVFKNTAIEKLVFPASVETIGNGVCTGCKALKVLEVAPGNAKYHSESNCIIETESKTLIAVSGDTDVIPGGVEKIASGLFSDSDITSITIPGSVVSIGANAFAGSKLTSVTVPASVKEIGQSAFSNCQDLRSATILGEVTEISERMFAYCSNLTDVSLPGSVTKVCEFAFSGCSNLMRVHSTWGFEIDRKNGGNDDLIRAHNNT